MASSSLEFIIIKLQKPNTYDNILFFFHGLVVSDCFENFVQMRIMCVLNQVYVNVLTDSI